MQKAASRLNPSVESWLMPTDTKSAFVSPTVGLGTEIRRLRHAVGYSQETLADIVGLEGAQIGGLEHGDNTISIHTLRLIANALGTKLSDILCELGY